MMEDRTTIIKEEAVKYAIVALMLLVAGVFIYSIVYVIIAKNTSVLDIHCTPLSATVTIDGEVAMLGENSVSPGSHEIKAEKYGFESETVTVNVVGGEKLPVYFAMRSNAEFTKDWYIYNPEDAKMLEGIAGYELDSESEKIQKNYPNLSKLPVKQKDFSIYQQACTISDVCIAVYAESYHREEALEYFKKKIDSDVGKYYFYFMSYYNPFLGEG